jgi:Arc/MetJ-type ribon-helix-helix transcriptional regulator
MASTKKVTVTLPAETADELSRRAETGAIPSVSAYVTAAVERQVRRDRDRSRLEEVFGGPPPESAVELVHSRMAERERRLGHARDAEAAAS